MQIFSSLEQLIQVNSSPGIRPGLDRIRRLLDILGNPQDSFPSIHIVGTNGKGSTTAFIESILRKHGLRTGRYTSPHLVHLSERVQVNGSNLPQESWERIVKKVIRSIRSDTRLHNDPPSFFETLTAAAFLMMKDEDIDMAVVEAGMGGRLDATNLLGKVILSVITPIALDHAEFLGNSIQEIAFEKFSVIRKRGKAIFSGGDYKLESLFLQLCETNHAHGTILDKTWIVENPECSLEGCHYTLKGPEKTIYEDIQTSMTGFFQICNSAMAIASSNLIREHLPLFSMQTIHSAIKETVWPGRFEVLQRDPPIVLDGAHNPAGMENLVDTLARLFKDSERNSLGVVFTSMKDKDFLQSLEILQKMNPVLFCCSIPGNSRCAHARDIASKAYEIGWPTPRVLIYDDPMEAFQEARNISSAVVICGSLYLAGYFKAREQLLNLKKE